MKGLVVHPSGQTIEISVSTYKQLQAEIEAQRKEIEKLKEEVFGEGIIQMQGDKLLELKMLITQQGEAIGELCNRLDQFQEFLTEGTKKTSKRAYILANAVRSASGGYITRSQAGKILAENGREIAPKTVSDAMIKAAEMYGMIYAKRKNGELVLAMA